MGRSSSLAVDDLMDGMSEFRSTQDVIRSTFKALHEVIRAQGEALKSLERQVEGKAAKSEVNSALSRKAAIPDVNKSLVEVAKALDSKASAEELAHKANAEDVEAALTRKADVSELKSLQNRSATIIALDGVREFCEQSFDKLSQMVNDRPDHAELRSRLETRPTHAELRALLDTKVDTHKLDHLVAGSSAIGALERSVGSKADSATVERVEGHLRVLREEAAQLNVALGRKADHESIITLLDDKVGVHDFLTLERRLAAASKEMGDKYDSLVPEFENKLSTHQQNSADAVDNLQGKLDADIDALKASMETSLQQLVEEVESNIQASVRRSEVDHMLRLKADRADLDKHVDKHFSDMREVRSEIEDLRAQLKESKEQNALLWKALGNKADVDDMQPLLETKANVEDVNQSLISVAQELDGKASVEALATSLKEQAGINSTLYSELCLGRWVWKGGMTRGGTIPWSTQSVNTDPSNLCWGKDKTTVQVSLAGLYEVTTGFYCRSKVSITLLVNNEPVMCISNPGAASNSGACRVVLVNKHSAGVVAGLTHTDFIALPEKAKVSISYQGEDRVEAFLGLRKM